MNARISRLDQRSIVSATSCARLSRVISLSRTVAARCGSSCVDRCFRDGIVNDGSAVASRLRNFSLSTSDSGSRSLAIRPTTLLVS